MNETEKEWVKRRIVADGYDKVGMDIAHWALDHCKYLPPVEEFENDEGEEQLEGWNCRAGFAPCRR